MNRVVAICFNNIANEMMRESCSRRELICARGLFVSAAEMSYLIKRDVTRIEKNVDHADLLLDVWMPDS